MLRTQALAYLCNHLVSINGEEFQEQASEETTKIGRAAKQELAALVSHFKHLIRCCSCCIV